MEATAEESCGLKIVSELHVNISAVNVNVTPHPSCSNLVLLLHPDYIIATQFSGETLIHKSKVYGPDSFFIPTSFYSISGSVTELANDRQAGGVRVKYSEPHDTTTIAFRLQVNYNRAEINANFRKECVRKNDLKTGVPYSIRCSCCRNTLTRQPVVFKSISTVPSNMDDVAENWFCHRRNNNVSVEQNSNILFATLTCYILKCLDNDRVLKDHERSVYRCKTCLSVLSEKSKTVPNQLEFPIECFKDKVLFDVAEEDPTGKTTQECTFLSMLFQIIENAFSSSVVCKVYLESQVSLSEKMCLLLWVIDPEMKRSVIEQPLSISCEEKLEFDEMMKVFYQVTAPETEVATQWRHTFTMDFHHISDSMFQKVVELLNQNAYSLQTVDSVSPGFSVSYLPVKY